MSAAEPTLDPRIEPRDVATRNAEARIVASGIVPSDIAPSDIVASGDFMPALTPVEQALASQGSWLFRWRSYLPLPLLAGMLIWCYEIGRAHV